MASKVSSKQTKTGEPIVDGLPICIPKVLMPRDDISLDKWATVACDQFETEPEYWKGMAEHTAGQPSALNIIFPEVYLASVTGADPSEDTKRIEEIGKTMKKYVSDKVFKDLPAAMVALDRKTPQVPTRKGLIVAVDLDQYNYNCPKPTPIRPTEKTIVGRLPPRIAIRKDAPLELPHIIMIIDDPGKTVIEPLFTTAGMSEKLYECSLFKEAGVVKGLTVTDAGTESVVSNLKALTAKETASATAAGREPAVLLIGDGNHSLATAKSCWEKLKEDPKADKEAHPARYALVELQNLHDEGVVFEPIHRIIEGADADAVQKAFETAWNTKATDFVSPQPLHSIVIVKKVGEEVKRFTIVPPAESLPVVSMTPVVDEFVEANKSKANLLFVHGEEPVDEAVKAGAVGILLPVLDKSRFLETIHKIGTLPRKAFSMGEANEKRFYIEARNILPDAL
jgi:hypothetical protein